MNTAMRIRRVGEVKARRLAQSCSIYQRCNIRAYFQIIVDVGFTIQLRLGEHAMAGREPWPFCPSHPSSVRHFRDRAHLDEEWRHGLDHAHHGPNPLKHAAVVGDAQRV